MKRIAPGILLLTLLAACQAGGESAATADRSDAGATLRSDWNDIIADTFGFDDDTRASISLDELIQGCPRVDCIPSIDDPQFVPVDEADFMQDGDLILAVTHNGETHAYAANILNAHEIVNDVIGGIPVAVTYCPLCGSGTAFERTLDGKAVEFGVSGVLHESDLVMYDRQTRSLWAQITAEAIVGPLTGARLKSIPVTMTEWGRWKDAHPDARVLSTDTGYDHDYSRDAYANYASEDSVRFPVSRLDTRLHAKAVVFGVTVGDTSIAYTEDYLREVGSLTDRIDNQRITIRYRDDGTVTAVNSTTGERLVPLRLYWFAWYTFHPDSLLVTGSG